MVGWGSSIVHVDVALCHCGVTCPKGFAQMEMADNNVHDTSGPREQACLSGPSSRIKMLMSAQRRCIYYPPTETLLTRARVAHFPSAARHA